MCPPKAKPPGRNHRLLPALAKNNSLNCFYGATHRRVAPATPLRSGMGIVRLSRDNRKCCVNRIKLKRAPSVLPRHPERAAFRAREEPLHGTNNNPIVIPSGAVAQPRESGRRRIYYNYYASLDSSASLGMTYKAG